MHDEVSETENIRKNLAIERMIVDGCDLLLDVNQVFVRQGTLIQVLCEKSRLSRSRLSNFGSSRERKESVRQVFLFTNHLLITARTNNGRLRLVKNYGKISLLECTLVEDTSYDEDVSNDSGNEKKFHDAVVISRGTSSMKLSHPATSPSHHPDRCESGVSLSDFNKSKRLHVQHPGRSSTSNSLLPNHTQSSNILHQQSHRHSTSLCDTPVSPGMDRSTIDTGQIENNSHTHRQSTRLSHQGTGDKPGDYGNLDFRLIWEPKDGQPTSIWLVASTLQEKAAWCSDISQCIEQLHFGDMLNSTQNDVSSVVMPQSVRTDPRLFNDDVDIKFSHTLNSCKVPQIRHATVDRLLDRLTDARFLSIDFLNTFLLTYRVFTTGMTVITALRRALLNLGSDRSEPPDDSVLQNGHPESDVIDGCDPSKCLPVCPTRKDSVHGTSFPQTRFSLPEYIEPPDCTYTFPHNLPRRGRRFTGDKFQSDRLNPRTVSTSTYPDRLSPSHSPLMDRLEPQRMSRSVCACDADEPASRGSSLSSNATRPSSPGQPFSPPPLIPRSPVFSGIFNLRDDPPLELPNLSELVGPKKNKSSRSNSPMDHPRCFSSSNEIVFHSRLAPLASCEGGADENEATAQCKSSPSKSTTDEPDNLPPVSDSRSPECQSTNQKPESSGSRENPDQAEPDLQTPQKPSVTFLSDYHHDTSSDESSSPQHASAEADHVTEPTDKVDNVRCHRVRSFHAATEDSQTTTSKNNSNPCDRGSRMSITDSLDLAIRLSCKSAAGVNGACQTLVKNAMLTALRCPGGLLQILSHDDPSRRSGKQEKSLDSISEAEVNKSPEAPTSPPMNSFQRSLSAFVRSFQFQPSARAKHQEDATESAPELQRDPPGNEQGVIPAIIPETVISPTPVATDLPHSACTEPNPPGKNNLMTPRSSFGPAHGDPSVDFARGSVVSWSGVSAVPKQKRSSVLSCPDTGSPKVPVSRRFIPLNLTTPETMFPTQARPGAVVTSSRRSRRRSSNTAAAQAFAVATAGVASPLEASGIMGFGPGVYRPGPYRPKNGAIAGPTLQVTLMQTNKPVAPNGTTTTTKLGQTNPIKSSLSTPVCLANNTAVPSTTRSNHVQFEHNSSIGNVNDSVTMTTTPQKQTQGQATTQRTKRSLMIVTASCLRVFNVVRHWITKYPDDFVSDSALKSEMQKLLELLISCPNLLPNDQKTASKLLQQVATDQLVQNRIDVIDLLTPSHVPSEKNFDALAALDIAEQLTFLDFQIFRSIRSEELLNQSWMKSDKEEKAKHVLLVCKRFNEVSRLVVSEIVSRPDLNDRVACIDKWVAIANICRCLQNYNGVLQICAALVNSSIYRLKRTWERVSKQTKQSIDRLQILVASDGRFKSMREALHRCDPPCIPYLGMYLTDLSFIEEGALNVTENNLVNFCKMRMIAHVIREIQQFHQTPYVITHRLEVTDYLLDPTRLLDEEKTYQASLTIEPRQSINRQASTLQHSSN